jgi:hypothetical protein
MERILLTSCAGGKNIFFFLFAPIWELAPLLADFSVS